ncbi:MAG TPA: hypothetical protein VMU94_10940 [Streptosporangiaceae bacterium]|nr:hypothetical protein [Streptosporangiaceae bacterium]
MRDRLNVIPVADKNFLITEGNGESFHLTREARENEEGVAAAPDRYLDDLEASYDRDVLEDPRWLETTLCGRRWILMASGEDREDYGAVHAPTCRRCLALLDKLFPEPALDPRFPLVAQVVADTIIEHGVAEILGVPGDQQTALRRDVRAAVKKRTGHGVRTYSHESLLIFACQPIYDEHADEHARFAAEAASRSVTELLGGDPAAPMRSPVRLSWDAWSID